MLSWKTQVSLYARNDNGLFLPPRSPPHPLPPLSFCALGLQQLCLVVDRSTIIPSVFPSFHTTRIINIAAKIICYSSSQTVVNKFVPSEARGFARFVIPAGENVSFIGLIARDFRSASTSKIDRRSLEIDVVQGQGSSESQSYVFRFIFDVEARSSFKLRVIRHCLGCW